MDTSLIDSIDWNSLEHAYGVASDAPKELRSLLGVDQIARENAVYDWLYSAAYHQGDVYSCTPSVICCVLHIIENEDINSLEAISCPLIRELLGFVSVCAITWRFVPEVGEAMFSGRELYKKYLNHSDTKTAEYAKMLVEICNEYENS